MKKYVHINLYVYIFLKAGRRCTKPLSRMKSCTGEHMEFSISTLNISASLASFYNKNTVK